MKGRQKGQYNTGTAQTASYQAHVQPLTLDLIWHTEYSIVGDIVACDREYVWQWNLSSLMSKVV